MIIVKIIFILLLVLAFGIFITRNNGVAVYAADSGISLGVNVLSAGPATINDFNYSSFNNKTLAVDPNSNENANSSPDVNHPEPIADSDIIKKTGNNQTANYSVIENDRGAVKGAESNKSPSWLKSIISKYVKFFKKIF